MEISGEMEQAVHFSRYQGVQPTMRARRCPTALLALALLGLIAVSANARADNPGYDRPGYGFTPAVLSAGDVTFEQGLPDFSRQRSDGITTTQYSADGLLRIGIGGPLELQLASDWNVARQSGSGVDLRSHGRGDSSLGLKLALPSSGSAFSWGLLGSVEFTDGTGEFRNDGNQYLLGLQLNLQAGPRQSLGLYMENVRSGGSNSTTVAVSDNYSLTRTVTLYAEAALLHAPDAGSGSVAGAGVAWLATPRLQLDAGFDHRLGGTAAEWQANLGVSFYFGR
jgi:hypothetical protein